MDKPAIPDSVADVTVDWMQRALAAGGGDFPAIERMETEAIGEGIGLMGALLRCHLTYFQEDAAAPRSVIVKLASPIPKTHRTGRLLKVYQREYDYYSRIAPSAPIRSPRLFYGDFDRRKQRLALVQEDLRGMVAVDQIQGASAAQALTAVRNIARMHGHFWNRTDCPPLVGAYDIARPRVMRMTQLAYLANLPAALRNFEHLLPGWAPTLAESFGARMLTFGDDLAAAPRTFIHGDFRLDNMFFGPGGDYDGFAAVDWQVSCIGVGLYDVAYFLGGSVTTETRREVEREALQEYHHIVRSMGGKDFTLDECWLRYRQSALALLLTIVIAGGGLELGDERGRVLYETMTSRALAAIEDLSAAEFLPGRPAMFSRANLSSTMYMGAYRMYQAVKR